MPNRLTMRTNAAIRRQRMKEANSKGTHSKYEWEEMITFFEHTCVKCFGQSGLANVEKDHITPLYQGGSNSIANIQPLCARCNASKGCENIDYRDVFAAYINKALPEKYKTY